MMKVFVDMDDKFENVIGYSTTNGMYEVIQDDTIVDVSKLSGYKLVVDENNQYHLVFDEDKYNKFLTSQNYDEVYAKGEELFNELSKSIVLNNASDEQAYIMRCLYSEWIGDGIEYNTGDRLMYNDKFYKVLQDHTSQSDWTPDTASSLYVEIADPSNEYPEFKQPTGAHDAYAKGSKVTFEGKKYVSLIDNNTWSPSAYSQGWQLVE